MLKAVALFLCMAVSSFAMDIPPFPVNMPKQVMSTTHRIEMHNGFDGDICSSTAVGSHALLTASHCDLGAPSVLVDGVETTITSRMADANDHTIYLVAMTFKEHAQFSQDTLKVGDEVWLRGNPDGLNQLVRYGHYAGPITYNEERLLMFDISGWHGDSGSSIFNKHGKIVAVTTYGFSDGSFGMLGCLEIRFTHQQLITAEA